MSEFFVIGGDGVPTSAIRKSSIETIAQHEEDGVAGIKIKIRGEGMYFVPKQTQF